MRPALAEQPAAARLVRASQIFLARLDAEQRQVALLPFESPLRLDWSAGAKPFRKGLQFGAMNPEQRAAAVELLRALLSPAGYVRVRHSMQAPFWDIDVWGETDEPYRFADDWKGERYYFTFFGTPDEISRWALSVEGANFSLNFVIAGGGIVSSTPQLFSARDLASPDPSDIPTGSHLFAVEFDMAGQLIAKASSRPVPGIVLSPQAPPEAPSIGDPQPSLAELEGVPLSALDESQRILVRSLIEETCRIMPAAVADERLQAIAAAGWDRVHFGWAGSTEPGQPHSVRIQGPTFVLDFVATAYNFEDVFSSYQCLWRSRRGDFALPLVEGDP